MGANNMFRITCVLFLMVLMSGALHAVTLKWEIKKDDRLEVVKTAKVKHYVNAQLLKQYEERDIVNLVCYEEFTGGSKVKGDFSIYQRDSSSEVFEKATLLEKHDSDFIIEPGGRFQVKKQDYMPNLRHIPTFPAGDIKAGDSWKGDAEMLLNNFSAPLKLTFPVEYMLKELKEIDGDDVAVIHYRFNFDKTTGGPASPQDIPKRIAAKNAGVMNWDITKKSPMDMDDQYIIVFVFKNPQNSSLMTQEFHMNIHTENKSYRVVGEAEKEKARDELAKEIGGDSGIGVTSDNRGLVLTMGDVHFDFDSYDIKEESRSKLTGVADVIGKKYPDHELVVEGHTDNVGDTDYNMKLSIQRARSVARYMKKHMNHDKISFQGFGEKNPVAENGTSAGRQKNRRVEIIIKMQ